MDDIAIKLPHNRELPPDQKEANMIRRRACAYILVKDKLYSWGFFIPLLKCVEISQIGHILHEIHEGINAQHMGGRSLS